MTEQRDPWMIAFQGVPRFFVEYYDCSLTLGEMAILERADRSPDDAAIAQQMLSALADRGITPAQADEQLSRLKRLMKGESITEALASGKAVDKRDKPE